MDYTAIKAIVEQAINDVTARHLWLYLLSLIIVAVCSFVGSYLRKKGENIATKEDVEAITRKIEDVRAEYNKQLESYKASIQLSHHLKLAALDTRLEKHQEAYTLWLALLSSIHEESVASAVDRCQRWWNENCLYLGDQARVAFKAALILAVNFRNIPNADASTKKHYFNEIMQAGRHISEAVSLPPIGDDEIKLQEIDSVGKPQLAA